MGLERLHRAVRDIVDAAADFGHILFVVRLGDRIDAGQEITPRELRILSRMPEKWQVKVSEIIDTANSYGDPDSLTKST